MLEYLSKLMAILHGKLKIAYTLYYLYYFITDTLFISLKVLAMK